MCCVLGVVRQSFYRWFQSPEGIRKKEDKRLLPEIRKIFMENRQVYGPKRIAEHLRKDGIPEIRSTKFESRNPGPDRVYRLVD